MRGRIAPIVTFGLLSVLAACSSSSSTEPKVLYDDDAHPTNVILHVYNSGFSASERLVVRDSSQWASVWATAFALRSSAPPLPAVDFAEEMVIVAALGTRSSGGYDIAIERVLGTARGREVSVVATAPGSDCVTTAALTQPVTIVKVAAKVGAVQFHEQAETRSCG